MPQMNVREERFVKEVDKFLDKYRESTFVKEHWVLIEVNDFIKLNNAFKIYTNKDS